MTKSSLRTKIRCFLNRKGAFVYWTVTVMVFDFTVLPPLSVTTQ